MRKLRPGFDAQDGMPFPIEAWGGKPPISNVQEMGGSSSRAGPFVWSGGSIPEFGQSGGQGLIEHRAKDAKRKTFNEHSVKTTLEVA